MKSCTRNSYSSFVERLGGSSDEERNTSPALFKKYKIFRNNLPLNIKIDISRAVKSNSLERLSFNNEKLNVDLSLDDSLGIHKADIRGEGQNVKMEDMSLENVTDEDVQVVDAPQASPSQLTQTSGEKVLNKYFESTSSDESKSENENFDQPGAMFIPMHSYAQGSGDKTHGEVNEVCTPYPPFFFQCRPGIPRRSKTCTHAYTCQPTISVARVRYLS